MLNLESIGIKNLISILIIASILTFLIFAYKCYIGDVAGMITFGILSIIVELDQIYFKLIQIYSKVQKDD
jgi:hypothetical protein